MPDLPEDEIDALYALPPGEFTAARDALVKRLRGEKQRDAANTVKALRRATMPAWAVNQVAHHHPDAVERLRAAGADLAAAQRRVLSGVKEAGLAAAARRRRDVLEEVWQLAASALREQGTDPQVHRQPVMATLEAASVDADAAAAVAGGRLTKELAAPSDFGAVGGFTLVAGDASPEEPGAEPEPPAADDDAATAQAREEERRRLARERAEAAAQKADEAQRKAGDARQVALRAHADAQRLQRQAEEAAERAADRAAKAEKLETTAAEARAEADRLAAEI